MSSTYDAFLRRMIEYRIKMDMTQTDISALIGKTQSQLSKMELGKTVVSHEVLDRLVLAGWDIDYMLTGQERFVWESDFANYLNGNYGKSWRNMKEVLIWALGQFLTQEHIGTGRDIYCEYRLFKLMMEQSRTETLMARVRRLTGNTQMVMADSLGVNIKKYCELEKGHTKPDAELLTLIYEISSCRPSLFFCKDEVHVERHLINDLWNGIDAEKQERILSFLEAARELCRS